MAPTRARRAAAGLTAVALAVTLAACGPDTTDVRLLAEESLKKSPVEDLDVIYSAHVIDAQAGDIVAEGEVFWLVEGLSAFPLESGELVVDIDAPLPEQLVDELEAGFLPEPQRVEDVTWPQPAATLAQHISIDTGRGIILVGRGGAYGISGQLQSTHWAISAYGEPSFVAAAPANAHLRDVSSRDGAIAKAETLRSLVENPDSVDIIVEGD